MQVFAKCRSVGILKNTILESAAAAASIHSTAPSFEKWKNKWASDDRSSQQPPKNYIRYVTRQRRADTKRAMKELLANFGASKTSFQISTDRYSKANERWDAELDGQLGKKSRTKSSAHHKTKHAKRMRKLKRDKLYEDFDEYPETIFQATFGNKCYTWSRNPRQASSFDASTAGFDWREAENWNNQRHKESYSDSDDTSCLIGSYSDRIVLGLPPKGPLKIKDVKNAFHTSALKWHPDKHQGPSQAAAEEKFKRCADAYKSLCNALSAAQAL